MTPAHASGDHTADPAETDTQSSTSDYSVNSFYALLVAEMAGQRKLYDLALGNYLLEAHRTQDPGVTARATQIAQYIGADQASLDAATLWVSLDKNNPQAQQALSLELVKAARFSESVIHLQHALDLDPLLNLGFLAVQGEQMSEGSRELWLESLTPLLQRYHGNHALLFNLASLHQQQQNLQVALDLTDQLLDENEKFYPAWSLKSRLHASLGDIEGALKSTKQALKQFPHDKAFTVLKARLYIKLKKIDDARDTFQELTERHPEDAHILLPLALTQLELKQYQEAKLALEQLLHLNQLLDEAHYYLGRIAQYQNQPDEALNHYLQMEGGREFLAAQNAIVQIYFRQQQHEKALAHIQTLKSKDAANQQAYFLMEVELLNRSGQYQASLEVLNAALQAYADNTDLRYSRAMVSEKLGNLDQLELDLGYIIDRHPDNATALNALGYTLADRTKRLDEALQLIEKARALAPKDPAIIDSLGWVYFRMGRLQESLDLLQQAFKAFPDAEVAAHLGEVLWVLGQQQEAKAVWKQGLQNQPDSQIIRSTLNRLQVQL